MKKDYINAKNVIIQYGHMRLAITLEIMIIRLSILWKMRELIWFMKQETLMVKDMFMFILMVKNMVMDCTIGSKSIRRVEIYQGQFTS